VVTDGLNPFAVLLFIGAVLTAVALAGAYLFSRITKRERLARISSRVFVGGAVLYLAIVLTGSIASQSRVLAPGEEKHICEIDCHLAYSVAGAKAESVGAGLIRHVVTVKVRFDEETISARRSRTAPLTPNRRYVALIDAHGRQYPGSTEGLRRPLIPGESYTTEIAFDVPAAAQSLRLVLRNNDAETALIISHENSLLHGKTTFALARAS
jgi:hypothetical protein